MSETLKTAEELLGDLSGFKNFRKDANDVLEELQAWRQDQYDDWAREIQEQIDDPKAQLRSVGSTYMSNSMVKLNAGET